MLRALHIPRIHDRPVVSARRAMAIWFGVSLLIWWAGYKLVVWLF